MPDKELTRAGFGPRAAAYIIDRALLFLGLAILRAPFALASFFGAGRLTADNFIFDYSVLDVVSWLLASAYFVLLTWFGGGTLGKAVMRLRVCREDGEPLRFIDLLYRETVGRFLSGILCIGYLMVLADKKDRAFHDWLCGTCVVYDGVSFPPRKKKAVPADGGWTVPGGEAGEAPGLPELPEADEVPAPGWSVPGGYPAPEAFSAPVTVDPLPLEDFLPAQEAVTAPEDEA